MATEFSKGSEWRRWELHIHTPDTKKNDKFDGTSSEEKWDKYYEDINNYIGNGDDPLKNIAVMAITDYLSIDNYKKVIQDNRLTKSIKLVLPNIEMRMYPLSKQSGINIHFIFNPEIVEQLDDLFFSQLKIIYDGKNYTATKNQLCSLGKAISPEAAEEQAYKIGIGQFIPTLDAIKAVFDQNSDLRKNTIIVVSNSSNDGVSGTTKHSCYFDESTKVSDLDATRRSVYQFADAIFSANTNDIEYFLGKRSDSPEEVKRKCRSLKPCIHGSDAHENKKIFEPDQKRYCWIKADPSFNGLKQILYEPEERVRISQTIPDYKAEYYVIDNVKFNDKDFQDVPIQFNENLTCIIGGKSTGKSILLHNLANAIDSNQVKAKEEKSSSITKNVENISVTWKDGKKDVLRKIVYIPQTYLNRLSDAKESTTEIDKIIEEIVWIDPEAKAAYTSMLHLTKEYKSALNMNILGLIENRKEINSVREDKKEIGNQGSIEAQIKKLADQKDALSSELDLSKEELELYDQTVLEMSANDEQILSLQKDLAFIEEIDSLVEKRELTCSFSEDIQKMMDLTIMQSLEAADAVWAKSKQDIASHISTELNAKKNQQDKLVEIQSGLKTKIQENKVISEISTNIQQENEKLKNLKALEKKEKNLVEKENKYLEDICSSIKFFKNFHTEYAKVINENPDFRSTDLEFTVDVPFKKEAFLDKILNLFDNRSTILKETISFDIFTEEQYTKDFLSDIVCKILDYKLLPKKGNTQETAIRDICTDWFEIKYNVKMDHDTIDVMSPGKKALVLLKLLIDLADSKCPILIDQPEDDLDNRSIFNDLIPFIKKKKRDRQIIIVTHNANVVLGSDAEEVIVANQQGSNSPNKKYRFEYRSGSIENNTSICSDDGNIETGILNSQGIQQHICDILEGGERAFELRKNKYHI